MRFKDEDVKINVTSLKFKFHDETIYQVELPYNPHAPVDMPLTAWSDWAELREQYTDCNRYKKQGGFLHFFVTLCL